MKLFKLFLSTANFTFYPYFFYSSRSNRFFAQFSLAEIFI